MIRSLCLYSKRTSSRHNTSLGIYLLIFILALSGCASIDPEIPESLQRSALEGDVQAQYEIGLKYYVARYDFWRGNAAYWEEAAQWFEMAANQNDPRAQYYLSQYYFNVHQDYDKSFELVRLSAEQGVAEAQYTLGMNYGQAWGTQQDLVLAYKWIALGNDGGVKGGSYADVEWLIWKANMNANQIAEGRHLVEEHLAQYGKSMLIKTMH